MYFYLDCFLVIYTSNQLQLQCDSSELGEQLCPVSSSLPLREHKVCIRVSFQDTFLRWLPPFVTNSCHYQQRKTFPFYTLLGSGCVLITYSMLSLIIAWLCQDYSSEAETADIETLLYCAVSPHRMQLPQMTLNNSGVNLPAL